MLLERVRVALRSAGTARPGDTLVVGVSGGPDSLALLDLLHRLSGSIGVSFHVAHLDHRLRAASADDARFVLSLAESLGCLATIEATDVAQLARERRLGVEEAARLARYSFFARVVAATGASAVALGHNADDQVETILLALLRGAGPGGLRGMRTLSTRHVEELGELRVLRPLLDVTRAEIEGYLRERGIEPRRDSTNAETSFRRNRVRHELLPALRAYNPRVGEAVLRLGRLANADEEYLDGRVAELWPAVAEEGTGAMRLRRGALSTLPASLLGRLLRRAFAGLLGDSRELEAAHVEAAQALLSSERTGGALDWPRGVSVRLDYEWLIVERPDKAAAELALPDVGIELAMPGITCLPTGDRIVARLTGMPCRWEDTGRDHADLDLDLAGTRLTARRRRPGDRIVPLGMRGEKKVQDLLVDAKVPRAARDHVPIVEGPAGIVWVAGVRVDERYRVEPGTKIVACLRVVRRDPDLPQR